MPAPFPAVGSENPPLSVIRKFVHLLDQSDLDFQEELEVARLREEVVTKIRGNQQLEKDLNLMDIKIGLLVKNRITLEVSRGLWDCWFPEEEDVWVLVHSTLVQLSSLESRMSSSKFSYHLHYKVVVLRLCKSPPHFLTFRQVPVPV